MLARQLCSHGRKYRGEVRDKTAYLESVSQEGVIGIVLPSIPYQTELTKSSSNRAKIEKGQLVLLTSDKYNFLDPMKFDVEAFVDEIMPQVTRMTAVIAFDCFPNLVASVINERMERMKSESNAAQWNGHGPSFDSSLLCANKYYMRRVIDPSTECYTSVSKVDFSNGGKYVMKTADTQFYTGTNVISSLEDAKRVLDATGGEESNYASLFGKSNAHILKRQTFYFNSLSLKLRQHLRIYRPSDVMLAHIEPWHEGEGANEMQAEVVVQGNRAMIVDTADIVGNTQIKAVHAFVTRTTRIRYGSPSLKEW